MLVVNDLNAANGCIVLKMCVLYYSWLRSVAMTWHCWRIRPSIGWKRVSIYSNKSSTIAGSKKHRSYCFSTNWICSVKKSCPAAVICATSFPIIQVRGFIQFVGHCQFKIKRHLCSSYFAHFRVRSRSKHRPSCLIYTEKIPTTQSQFETHHLSTFYHCHWYGQCTNCLPSCYGNCDQREFGQCYATLKCTLCLCIANQWNMCADLCFLSSDLWPCRFRYVQNQWQVRSALEHKAHHRSKPNRTERKHNNYDANQSISIYIDVCIYFFLIIFFLY